MTKHKPYIYEECTNNNLEQELVQLGIIPGTIITLVEHKYSKHSLCVQVNNSKFAFRKTSAEHMWVKGESNG